MIIDFHTHAFPDKVAVNAIPKLTRINQIQPSTNGTIDGLRASMEDAGIDLSVVLPVVTDPHQFDSILRFASLINETYADAKTPRLLSFGGVHPQSDKLRHELQLLKNEGIQGIKLHPYYQDTVFDDIRYMRLIYTASELGLIVVTHAGIDPYMPTQNLCTPDMILHVLDEVAPPKMVLAHFGNNENYEESIKKLCGKHVYLDTAYSFVNSPDELLVQLVQAHGADKILFASDAPWTIQKVGVEKLKNLQGLSDTEKEQIFSLNAKKLLKL